MDRNQKLLSFLPTGALGIDRMAVGCYKTGALKALSSIFLWLTPIPWVMYGMDAGATILDDKYMFCEGSGMNPEVAKKVGKFFAYASGIVMAAAAAYQAQKFAKKMGMGKMTGLAGKMAGKIPGGLGKFAGMMGGAREDAGSFHPFNLLLLAIIGLSLYHSTNLQLFRKVETKKKL